MLEPVVRKGTGKVLLGLGATACVLVAFWNESLTTRAGTVPLRFVMPGFAALFLLRLAGVAAGERLGRSEMPWGFRVASWLVGAGNAWVFGLLSSVPAGMVAAGLVAADVAGALSPRRPDGPVKPRAKAPPSGVLLLGGALAFLVGLHFLVAPRLAWWPLFDWGAAVLVAMVALRVGLARGGPARDEDARPPAHHRVHARTERPREDPQRSGAEAAVRMFRERGDVDGLVVFADDVARLARLPENARRELRSRVPAAAARPGTSREADLDAVVALLERTLEERKTRGHEVPEGTEWHGRRRAIGAPAGAKSHDAIPDHSETR